MSFDILFQSSHRRGQTAEVANPFTGETQVSDVVAALTDAERDAVRNVLRAHGAKSADEFGYYVPSLSDGFSVEAQFKGLNDDPNFSGGMISLHGISNAIAEFLYAMADAGNFVMQPIIEGNPAVVTKLTTADSFAERCPDVLVAQTPTEIAAIISSDVNDWEKYRGRVL